MFPLETQTVRDVEVPLTVFQQNEERDLESERQEGEGETEKANTLKLKQLSNAFDMYCSSFIQVVTACMCVFCVTARICRA